MSKKSAAMGGLAGIMTGIFTVPLGPVGAIVSTIVGAGTEKVLRDSEKEAKEEDVQDSDED